MSIESHLKRSFGHADLSHFEWQTGHPYVAEQERALVRSAFLPLGDRVLDVGCGEGATLLHLGVTRGATGVDLFEEKIAFARERLPDCTFTVGSAYELPFADGSFDHVIARDLVHHLESPGTFVSECSRVLAKGGRLDMLETCGNNPLIVMHSLFVPVERGQLRSRLGYLRSLLKDKFEIHSTSRHQALPLHRLVFHPQLGLPRSGSNPAFRRAVRSLEGAAHAVLPKALWAYVHVRAVKMH